MDLNAIQLDLRTRLAKIAGIKTCRLGIESNISPNDYPIIRIAIDKLKKRDIVSRSADIRIYAGLPLIEGKDTLEDITQALVTLEDKISALAQEGNGYRCIHQQTVMSGGLVEHYQLIAILFECSWMLD
jgi:hypothetical protein